MTDKELLVRALALLRDASEPVHEDGTYAGPWVGWRKAARAVLADAAKAEPATTGDCIPAVTAEGCPWCGGILSPVSPGRWKCDSCGDEATDKAPAAEPDQTPHYSGQANCPYCGKRVPIGELSTHTCDEAPEDDYCPITGNDGGAKCNALERLSSIEEELQRRARTLADQGRRIDALDTKIEAEVLHLRLSATTLKERITALEQAVARGDDLMPGEHEAAHIEITKALNTLEAEVQDVAGDIAALAHRLAGDATYTPNSLPTVPVCDMKPNEVLAVISMLMSRVDWLLVQFHHMRGEGKP